MAVLITLLLSVLLIKFDAPVVSVLQNNGYGCNACENLVLTIQESIKSDASLVVFRPRQYQVMMVCRCVVLFSCLQF